MSIALFIATALATPPRATSAFEADVTIMHVVSQPAPVDPSLFACRKKTAPVAAPKHHSDVKDLITWVMSFTCKNFLLDPRVISTGKSVTVNAPSTMSHEDAYRLFLKSLSAMDLTIVPKGNVLRIVDTGAAVCRGVCAAVYRKAVRSKLSVPVTP